MTYDPLERRLAMLEEIVKSLSQFLMQKSERELQESITERDLLLKKREAMNRRFKILDDILIRIEVLEEAVPPPSQFEPED